MSLISMPSPKYRPYFSASELLEIINALKQSPTPSRIRLIQYLETFSIKINHGIISSNYTPNPVPSLEEKLGFDDLLPSSQQEEIKDNNSGKDFLKESFKLTPKEARKLAYSRWVENPINVTAKEIHLVNEYRYENGLM